MTTATARKPAAGSKKTSRAKPPTLAEVQAIVRAWLAANHPEVEHATVTRWDSRGGGTDLEDVLGPPTEKAWHTNDIPETEAERKAADEWVERRMAERLKEDKEKEAALQKADEIDPTRKTLAWLARWANAMAILNWIDGEIQDLDAAVRKHKVNGIHPDYSQVRKLALDIHTVATDGLTLPFRGDLPLSHRLERAKGGA